METPQGNHVRGFWQNDEVAPEERRSRPWFNLIMLLVSLAAGAVVFLPFAFDTSPWDAVTLRVPGNQGNWWHALVGAPFFLAFPMIWLRVRSLFTSRLSTSAGGRILWIVVGLSICGTILVELPFLFHLAGTRGWPSLSILCVGFGILIASGFLLFLRRRDISPANAYLVGLNTAYLANAALCLVVYSSATGSVHSRSGWLVTMVIVWPMVMEITWIFIQTFRARFR